MEGSKRQQALDLERLLTKQFGPDFRNISVGNVLSTFSLAQAFDECGLEDPRKPPESHGVGIFQMMPSKPSK